MPPVPPNPARPRSVTSASGTSGAKAAGPQGSPPLTGNTLGDGSRTCQGIPDHVREYWTLAVAAQGRPRRLASRRTRPSEEAEMATDRTAEVTWNGSLTDGSGRIDSTTS